MRIAVGGIMHESNTFSSFRTDRRRFEEGSLTRGAQIVEAWRDAHHEMGGFIAAVERYQCELVPTTMAWATPAGPVDDLVLDEVVADIIAGCQKHSVDGLLLALHGAMVTERHPSADGEVLRRIRAAVGPELPIVASLDFHANVSAVMAADANALVGYQTYPHVDQRERGMLAGELLVRSIRKEIQPVTAISKPPMILNLLGQDTNREPMKSLMSRARESERQPGMLSVSVMAGFPYADVPDMGPAVIAVADGDAALAQRMADELGQEMWTVRHDLYVPCLPPEQAVREAVESEHRPALLIDLGDNIGGGSAGDGTVLLAELIRQKARRWIVVLYSPDGVREARSIGVGQRFARHIGGTADRMHGEPIHIEGTVESLHDGKWEEPEARHGGRRLNDQGPTAVIAVEGENKVVLNSLRTPPFSLGQLTSLGIDPKAASIIVVKAAVAYKAAYAPLGARVIEADTPGLTAINPTRFSYKRIRRPMFRLD